MKRENSILIRLIFVLVFVISFGCSEDGKINSVSWDKATLEYIKENCAEVYNKKDFQITYNHLGLNLNDTIISNLDDHLLYILSDRKKFIDYMENDGRKLINDFRSLRVIEFYGSTTKYIFNSKDDDYYALEFGNSGSYNLTKTRSYSDWFIDNSDCIIEASHVINSLEVVNKIEIIGGGIRYNVVSVGIF